MLDWYPSIHGDEWPVRTLDVQGLIPPARAPSPSPVDEWRLRRMTSDSGCLAGPALAEAYSSWSLGDDPFNGGK
jgi:hypothetical protein